MNNMFTNIERIMDKLQDGRKYCVMVTNNKIKSFIADDKRMRAVMIDTPKEVVGVYQMTEGNRNEIRNWIKTDLETFK